MPPEKIGSLGEENGLQQGSGNTGLGLIEDEVAQGKGQTGLGPADQGAGPVGMAAHDQLHSLALQDRDEGVFPGPRLPGILLSPMKKSKQRFVPAYRIEALQIRQPEQGDLLGRTVIHIRKGPEAEILQILNIPVL